MFELFNKSAAMRRMLKAREKVARRNVFFASILYTARLIETQETPYGMETMFTNGIDIFFHPNFVAQEDQFIEGVVLHETLHCAFDHVRRRQHRDPALWNMACDYAINPLVASVYQLPKGALIDPKFDGMSAERIYEHLKKEAEKNAKNQPKECSGRMRDPTPEELEKAAREWRRVVKMAAEKAEKAGTLHGQLKSLIEEIFPSEKLDWRKTLEDMARDAKSDDNCDWARPNRRFIGEGIYMPGRINDRHFRLVACLDASGSVSEHLLKEMRAELMNLLDQKIVTSVVLIATDTRICNKEEVFDSEGVKNFSLGNHGGGTCFDAAMDVVATVEDAVGCVFLTDMQTSSFGKDPGIPVVWCDWTGHGNQQVPFGRVTSYKSA